jgi:hypothetical protein
MEEESDVRRGKMLRTETLKSRPPSFAGAARIHRAPNSPSVHAHHRHGHDNHRGGHHHDWRRHEYAAPMVVSMPAVTVPPAFLHQTTRAGEKEEDGTEEQNGFHIMY